MLCNSQGCENFHYKKSKLHLWVPSCLHSIKMAQLSPCPSEFWLIKLSKVHIFWAGHKILWNLHRRFDHYYIAQIYGGNFTKNCGLLRTYEHYQGKLFKMLPLQMRETQIPKLQKYAKRLEMEKHPFILIIFFIAVL